MAAPTIKDIARRLGVSVGTVSKGLNGAPDVSERMRRLILDTAVEMGYRKRQGPSGRKRACILVNNMDYSRPDDFGRDIVLGFGQGASQMGWDFEVVEASVAFQRGRSYESFLLEERLAGGFAVGFALEDPWMAEFAHTSYPTALLDNVITRNPLVGSVGTDTDEAMGLAIDHLRARGHERIAFLGGSTGSHISNERMDAYRRALRARGMVEDERLAAWGWYVPEAADEHVPAFLEAGATAVLCGSDRIAVGVMEALRARGLEVPGDVSVVGFDDLPLAEQTTPPLTTLRQDRLALGKSGFQLLQALEGGLAISRTTLHAALVLRESTAEARTRVPAAAGASGSGGTDEGR